MEQLTGILPKLWECSGLFHELFKGFSNDSCSLMPSKNWLWLDQENLVSGSFFRLDQWFGASNGTNGYWSALRSDPFTIFSWSNQIHFWLGFILCIHCSSTILCINMRPCLHWNITPLPLLSCSQTKVTSDHKTFWPCHLNKISTCSILFITSIFKLDSLALFWIVSLNIVG